MEASIRPETVEREVLWLLEYRFSIHNDLLGAYISTKIVLRVLKVRELL